ncbi:MAG: hypothetical protein RL379_740 [Bacillota bacterium]|jgi:biotin-[acetyl-CoA-carboxylase] ligase BirA-like protein
MNVMTLDSIDSTNNFIKTNINSLPHLTVVRARYQTAGRGQLSRQWMSNPNENILVSFLFKNFTSSVTPQTIEKIAITSSQNFLLSYGVKATHKLPNDLLVGGKKIAGMLIETRHIDATLEYVILGIGININQKNFTGLANATSLALITNKVFEIDEIFASFLKECHAFETL